MSEFDLNRKKELPNFELCFSSVSSIVDVIIEFYIPLFTFNFINIYIDIKILTRLKAAI